ncbi:MAG: zinc ribbon domain-containing protein [Longilinea sp.]|nr:zinc ribbon domain-containing protein [Longilinea sp.]NMD31172.1 zinc ribbon domain-containing protein [Chloroflexota bacterium]
MPIYEYICQTCGHKFDALRSMKDADSPIECKNCHSEETRRALSVCNCQSDGHAISGSGGGCNGCSGGSCSHCGH